MTVKKKQMPLSAKDVSARLNTHEAVCAERWKETIERIKRVEMILIGSVGAGMLLAGVGDALYNALKGNSKAEHHEKRKEDKAKDAYNASVNSANAKQQTATEAANTAQTKAISDYHTTMSNMASSSHLAVTGGTEQVRNNSHAAAGTF